MKKNVQCPHCGKAIPIGLLTADYEEKIKEKMQKENVLALREKEQIIEFLRNKLTEASNRIDNATHSQQASGECLELLVEENLRKLFPMDEIVEFKKGKQGPDWLQVVKSDGVTAKIVYEVKNTNNYSRSWESKLRGDNLTVQADIMIIVTKTMPSQNARDKFLLVDDVWVCQYNYIQELALALRYGLLKLKTAIIVQKGKETKSQQLFKYITSAEFKNAYQSILDAFINLQESHQKEKLQIVLHWKSRETLLDQLLISLTEHSGMLKSIVGNTVPEVPMLGTPQAN